jgi:hypothetical protein
VVTVTQTNNNTAVTNAPLFQVFSGQAYLLSSTCTNQRTMTVIAGGTGAQITVPTPGSYIIQIKYSTKSIAGAPVPVPSTITYNFKAGLSVADQASVLLVP